MEIITKSKPLSSPLVRPGEYLVFKTNVNCLEDVYVLRDEFDFNDDVLCWSIDLHDTDKVLRIGPKKGQDTGNFITTLSGLGIKAELLR